MFLDYCCFFSYFLFFFLSWHLGWLRWPSCLPEERRVGLGGCDVMGFLQLSEHAQCVHPRVQVLVLDGHKDGKLNKWVTLKKISLSHSEINENKKPNKSSFPSLFPQDTNSIYTGIQVRLVELISLVLSLQTYYVPKVCLKAKGTLKNKIERVMYFCL